MHIVIKIPKEKYQWIKEHRGRTDYQITEMLYNRVRKGTPLPKGHGRLIDADVLWDSYHANDYDFYEALDDTETIIEADAESEDEE
jgi:hypothetical protein